MELARLIAPTDPHFAEAARALHAARPDLHGAYPDPAGADFAVWLATAGVCEHPERLGRYFPPVPPLDVRRTGCGVENELVHLRTGIEDARALAELWRIYAERPLESVDAVLDFGCGSGRVLRWLAAGLPRAICHGTDVRAAGIEWCRAHLAGRYDVNGTAPPLPLPDRSIDLVYSLSIFSHLNRASNLAWIRELARVCKPDGRILISTHGAFALAVVQRSAEHQAGLRLSADEARGYLRRLERERFVFHALERDFVRSLDGVEDEYGQAFFSEDFVRREWAPWVELLGSIPAAQNLFQDFHVLRPR